MESEGITVNFDFTNSFSSCTTTQFSNLLFLGLIPHLRNLSLDDQYCIYSTGMNRNKTNKLSAEAGMIEETLASLDKISRAKPLPFLYMRIQARLNTIQVRPNKYTFLEKIEPVFSRPIVAVFILLLVISFDSLAMQLTLANTHTNSENPNEDIYRGVYSDEILFFGVPDQESVYLY